MSAGLGLDEALTSLRTCAVDASPSPPLHLIAAVDHLREGAAASALRDAVFFNELIEVVEEIRNLRRSRLMVAALHALEAALSSMWGNSTGAGDTDVVRIKTLRLMREIISDSLMDGKWKIRLSATNVLGLLCRQHKGDVETLLISADGWWAWGLLKDEHPEVRVRAVETFANLPELGADIKERIAASVLGNLCAKIGQGTSNTVLEGEKYVELACRAASAVAAWASTDDTAACLSVLQCCVSAHIAGGRPISLRNVDILRSRNQKGNSCLLSLFQAHEPFQGIVPLLSELASCDAGADVGSSIALQSFCGVADAVYEAVTVEGELNMVVWADVYAQALCCEAMLASEAFGVNSLARGRMGDFDERLAFALGQATNVLHRFPSACEALSRHHDLRSDTRVSETHEWLLALAQLLVICVGHLTQQVCAGISVDAARKVDAAGVVRAVIFALLPFTCGLSTPADALTCDVSGSRLQADGDLNRLTTLLQPVPCFCLSHYKEGDGDRLNRSETLHLHQLCLPKPWCASSLSSESTCAAADETLAKLCAVEGSDNFSSYLSSVQGDNLKLIVDILRKEVKEHGWRDGEGIGLKHAIAAVVRASTSPHIAGEDFGRLLPLILPLAEDFDTAHAAVGFSLLRHMMAATTPTELAWYSGLLWEVLSRCLRTISSPQSSSLCISCCLILLKASPRGGPDARNSQIKALEVIALLTRKASTASTPDMLTLVVAGLAALIDVPQLHVGFALVEHLWPLLLCLVHLLRAPSLRVRLTVLRALQGTIIHAWPRVPYHASKLLCSILLAMADARVQLQDAGAEWQEEKDGVRDNRLERMLPSALPIEVISSGRRVAALVLVIAGERGAQVLSEVSRSLCTLRLECETIASLARISRETA